VVIAVCGFLLLFVARCAQVRAFPQPMEPQHLTEKQAYLDALPRVDPAAAPSFVVIFFDDLGYGDLSSHGNQLIDTPRIDRAAAEGLRMTHFYSASPVCSPARAALLTGRYPPRTGTDRHVFFPDGSAIGIGRRMLGWANELPGDEVTVAEVLQRAGYATGMVGKWHLGHMEGHRPTDFGFASWLGVLFSNDMWPLDLYRDEEVIEKDERPGGAFAAERDEATPLGAGGIDQSRLTERYTAESIAFLEAHRDEPFFLYVAHTFPHVPHYPSTDHAGQSRGGRYGDVVEDLDRSTGEILDALDRLGLADSTLVLITSDNGADYNGSPGGLRGRKGDTYEGGQRVPMIARWPGRVPVGATSDAPAMNVDVFPTLLSLAGLPLPSDREIDGEDITSLFEGDEARDDRALFYFPVVGSRPDAIRVGQLKWLRETGDWGRNRGHLSRVDLDAEGHELSDLHPERAEALAAQLETMRERIGQNPRGWLEH
jgi:arylsulfatase A-like enzyme